MITIEGVLDDHIVWDVFQVYPHVLVLLHWDIEVIVDDVLHQVAGPFAGVGDDGVEVDLEVKKADFWGSGVAIVGEFVVADYQANVVSFSLGEIDVADKVGIGIFSLFGDGVFGNKEDGIGPFNVFWRGYGIYPHLMISVKNRFLWRFPKFLCRGRIREFGERIRHL